MNLEANMPVARGRIKKKQTRLMEAIIERKTFAFIERTAVVNCFYTERSLV